MIKGSIDTSRALYTVKFWLLWSAEKVYKEYITNKDQVSLEEFTKQYESIKE